MTGFERQRLNMVESQLRPNEVTEPRLLAAMRALPRERFVPPRLAGLAYIDEAIEVFPAIDGAPARFLLAPMVLARLVQLAAIEPQDSVLDIGCATGYSTAVLASLGRRVTGLEPEPELASAARDSLRELGIDNADIVEGPLGAGLRRSRALRCHRLERQRAGRAGEPFRAAEARWQACGRPVGGRESVKPGPGISVH